MGLMMFFYFSENTHLKLTRSECKKAEKFGNLASCIFSALSYLEFSVFMNYNPGAFAKR